VLVGRLVGEHHDVPVGLTATEMVWFPVYVAWLVVKAYTGSNVCAWATSEALLG
jgi:hypothetical protein